MSHERGKLASGVGCRMKLGTETIILIHKHQVPAKRKATYANSVCDYRPLKYDRNRLQLAVGGNILIYAGDPSSLAVSLLDSKIIFKSTILTPGDQFSAQT